MPSAPWVEYAKSGCWTDASTFFGSSVSWSAEEDRGLVAARAGNEELTWDAVAVLVPGRGAGACQARWYKLLRNGTVNEPERSVFWSGEEDEALVVARAGGEGLTWDAIAALVPGRTTVACWNRWQKLKSTVIVEDLRGSTWGRGKSWSGEEDGALVAARTGGEELTWDAIAMRVPGRGARACQVRWYKLAKNGAALNTESQVEYSST